MLEDRAVGPVLDELVRARVLTGTERDTVVVALARLVMFTWAGHGVITTRSLLAELHDHVRAGRMTRAGLFAFWRDGLDHERWLHLFGVPVSDAAHALDTDARVAPLRAARAAAPFDPADPHAAYLAELDSGLPESDHRWAPRFSGPPNDHNPPATLATTPPPQRPGPSGGAVSCRHHADGACPP